MSKRARQYIGILAAVVAYYVIHEGAHLVYALITGTFKRINLMTLGVQVDVFAERMSDTQLGVFCLVGAVATFAAAYVLVLLAGRIAKAKSKLLRAVVYYITVALLLLDPLYLSLLCGLFGCQTNAWAKGTQARNKPLFISFIVNLGVAAFACVILYIILPIVNG